ncbi:unnamed protein product [Spodoptera littoralis]|uniref:MADF domain-containing protein n=1 Tax=Spodoptera littoralis TaxID=7109 RepID=A0A9P0IHF9_SPOLI|nr:unnamed protein product [Spodoptera littoralis]CAH1647043.1 unnamed protein product [Spodoptera littoralis]
MQPCAACRRRLSSAPRAPSALSPAQAATNVARISSYQNKMDSNNKWKPKEQQLIQLVKDYKLCDIEYNTPLSNRTTIKKVIWGRISRDLGRSEVTCRRLWINISIVYKRLAIMINEGKLSVSETRKNHKLAKYFDGSLDFLDTWINHATRHDVIKVKLHESTKLILSQLLGYDIDMETNEASNNNKICNDVKSVVDKADAESISKEDCHTNVGLANFMAKHIFSNRKFKLKTYLDDLEVAIVCSVQEPKERRLLIKEIDAIVSDLLQG